ncbi:MAG TPA: hypothetical protein VFD58_26855 [Blastocatellia bacterium]|nr:hypothetical protein [Blastocatellia bacterium]
MPKITTRLVIVVLTFFLAVSAATAWRVSQRAVSQEMHLIVPKTSWEQIFFQDINSVANATRQTDLRKTRLGKGEFEVRVWWGFGLSPLEGVTLRCVTGQWSAVHVKADNYYKPERADKRELRPPKSGWEDAWNRLVNAGILRLPDASELGCNVGGLDGISFVVETNSNMTYRTYMYDNPSEAKCPEAKQMMEIFDIILEEFRFGEQSK